ncbi:MAG: amino acid adenylation domain-containing protein [Lachnospiraceae bacterium]|nr:amino acid adenylation domain-containing protein [Lachnospiraceae bacterium]
MGRSLLDYLENSVQQRPEKIAVLDGSHQLSYRQLGEQSRRIGTALSKWVEPRGAAGLFLEQETAALPCLWGTLYAGAFYSFLNPDLPDRRLSLLAERLEPGVIITCPSLWERARILFPGYSLVLAQTLLQEEENPEILARIRRHQIDTDPLYLNFTSGSTGIPKGILVAHRSVLDFIDPFTRLFDITEQDVIANQAPFDFDVSVKDIYSAALKGATLAVIPRRCFSQPAALVDFLCDQGATTLIWAVSALCLLSSFHGLEYRRPERLKKILFSGEVMPGKVLKYYRRFYPELMMVNLYGPTEITCNCLYHVLDPAREYGEGIPIGKPFPNEDVFLLDEEDRLIREKEKRGEICVRGTALALGYFKAPELNALSFCQNPLNPHFPERIYRTGDLGRYGEEGELFFCGRKDFQIKYQGHRIELEEIERAIGALEGVERCCCVFDEKKSRLKAFYIGSALPPALLEQLKKEIPSFMLPSSLLRMEAFPLTKNGKTDRKALLEYRG